MNILSKEQISNLPEWLPIEGFPKYEVNCMEGLVRNVKTLRVLKAFPNRNGYPFVVLHKNSKGHPKTVHRIVAMTSFRFYGIPTDGLDVCHLDEERFDARISNLALGSRKENLNFEKAKQRMSKSKKGENHPNFGKHQMCYWFGKHRSEETKKKLSDAIPKKAVGAYKNGELILRFRSTREAGRNGFDNSTVIACCRGKRKSHKGYEWRYLSA